MAMGPAFIERGSCTHVVVDEASGVLTYCPPHKNANPVAIFQAKMVLSEEHSGFEMQIVKTGRSGCCSIGLIQGDYPTDNQPGWRKWSIGYHADDGFIYANGTSIVTKSGRCIAGDVMGIKAEGLTGHCITKGKLKVSFFKNRLKIGEQLWPLKVKHVYPAIGLHSPGEQVKLLQYRCLLQQVPADISPSSMIHSGKLHLLQHRHPDILAFSPCALPAPVGVFMAKYSLTREHNYFELKIENLGQKGFISIGVAHNSYNMRQQPGWCFGSVGYHADDQGLYYNNDGHPVLTLPQGCARGDVMGCGFCADDIQYNADGTPCYNQILRFYFTRNGNEVHTCPFQYFGGGIHPVIGMHSPGEKVTFLRLAGASSAVQRRTTQPLHAPLRRLSAPRLMSTLAALIPAPKSPDETSSLQPVYFKEVAEPKKKEVTSPLSDHSSETNDMFMCSVCLDPYDEGIHQPKLLPCHHTFCTECLHEMLGCGVGIQCPTCRLAIDLPKGVSSLQTNFYINNAMELLRSMNERTAQMSVIEERSPVVVQQPGCKNHSNQPLSFYCKTCREAICRDCTVLKHSVSSGHNVVDINDIKIDCIKALQKREEKIERALAVSEKQRKELELVYGNLNVKRDQTHLWVDAKFDRYVGLVNEFRDVLKEDIEQCYTTQCDSINLELKQSMSNTEHLSMAKNHIAKQINSDNVHLIISAASDHEVDCDTEKILESNCKVSHRGIRFISDAGEEKLKQCLQNIGKIVMDE